MFRLALSSNLLHLQQMLCLNFTSDLECFCIVLILDLAGKLQVTLPQSIDLAFTCGSLLSKGSHGLDLPLKVIHLSFSLLAHIIRYLKILDYRFVVYLQLLHLETLAGIYLLLLGHSDHHGLLVLH